MPSSPESFPTYSPPNGFRLQLGEGGACCLCLADSHLPNCLESHVDVCSISQECDVLKIADASSKKKKKTIYKTKKNGTDQSQ